MEKNGFRRAVQEPCDASLARGRNDDLRTAVIDGLKIILARRPHAGKAGQMINLLDAVHRVVHQVRIEHRALHILHVRQAASRRPQIENAHLSAPRRERRYQMLSDEAGAASDKYPSHECGCASPWGSPG